MMEGLDILLVEEISYQKQRYAGVRIVYTSISISTCKFTSWNHAHHV